MRGVYFLPARYLPPPTHSPPSSHLHGPAPFLPSLQTVTFKPLPPPRVRLEPVAVTFTKLETDHLPARENREEEIKGFKKMVRYGQGGGDRRYSQG